MSEPTSPNPSSYEILDVLGRGKRSVVYRVRHKESERVLALKVYRADNPVDLHRLARCAEVLALLQALPTAVQLFEVGEFNGQPFLALECADAGSLADHLDGTPLLPQQAARLTANIASIVN